LKAGGASSRHECEHVGERERGRHDDEHRNQRDGLDVAKRDSVRDELPAEPADENIATRAPMPATTST
jgi:hypothetical protein